MWVDLGLQVLCDIARSQFLEQTNQAVAAWATFEQSVEYLANFFGFCRTV